MLCISYNPAPSCHPRKLEDEMVIPRVQLHLPVSSTNSTRDQAISVRNFNSIIIPEYPSAKIGNRARDSLIKYSTYIDPNTSTTIDFFQLNISAFQLQIYPDLGNADLAGYNGISPGPTFRVQRGRQSVVRVVNQIGI